MWVMECRIHHGVFSVVRKLYLMRATLACQK
jgi:hypothetical protein